MERSERFLQKTVLKKTTRNRSNSFFFKSLKLVLKASEAPEQRNKLTDVVSYLPTAQITVFFFSKSGQRSEPLEPFRQKTVDHKNGFHLGHVVEV